MCKTEHGVGKKVYVVEILKTFTRERERMGKGEKERGREGEGER
jgi:hypothetical protein